MEHLVILQQTVISLLTSSQTVSTNSVLPQIQTLLSSSGLCKDRLRECPCSTVSTNGAGCTAPVLGSPEGLSFTSTVRV